MIRHDAARFMHVTTFLASSQTAYSVAKWGGHKVNMKFESYAEEIDGLLPVIEALQLPNSYKSLVRLRTAFEETISGKHEHSLEARFGDFKDRLQDELAETYFLALAPLQARLWDSDRPPLGDEFAGSFPSATDDLFEAAKCLAVERGTACVMHLMRATEAPLKALAAALNVGVQNDWGSYIREIDKELVARLKAAGKRTPDEAFFAETNASFERVKRAWRNPSMHLDHSYTVERAQTIYGATRDFMVHLAPRIRE